MTPTDESQSSGAVQLPGTEQLDAVFRVKYGDPETAGWGPRMRRTRGHYTPDDVYEALVDSLVGGATRWIDVGCGRDLFPSNRKLAQSLADRCARLVGVDPDETLEDNPFVHEKVRGFLGDYTGDPVDLITLRMVAEHVEDPAPLVADLHRCLVPGGRAVIYTVNRRSPMPLLTTLAPMGIRHRVKKWLWNTEERDTFPTRFRMNTRKRLRSQMEAGGLTEEAFGYLDDCRTFARFKAMHWLELTGARAFRAVGLRYPENCLLGVYRRH